MGLHRSQILIAPEKITAYLLVEKRKNDKSKFLLSLGYSIQNWEELANDICVIAENNEPRLERESEFGDLYSIKGFLKIKAIITIWLQQTESGAYRFVTLYPDHEQSF